MMKFITLFLSLFLVHSAFASEGDSKEPETIQVLLEKDAKEALLEVRGPYYIFNPKDGSRISSGLLGKRFLVHAATNGIKWGEEFLGIYQIYVVPRSEEASIFVNGIQYEGAIAVFVANDNHIHIVNDIEIEKFVKAVLTPKFPFPLELEVMSALAILARTDSYYSTINNQDALWHVNATETGYVGCALNTPNSFIEKVVDSTKDLILVHSEHGKNMPFPATWTEHSAGQTAAFSAIFRKELSYEDKGVEAPHAKMDRNDARWQFTLSKNEIGRLFDVSSLKGIELFVDKESNKAYAIRLKGQSFHKDISFFEFQNKIGGEKLKSNDFQIDMNGNQVAFTGYGAGHSVGLCIYSASAMAQNGANAPKILSKFYPESFLFNLAAVPHLEKISKE